jgi:hypothetical protein
LPVYFEPKGDNIDTTYETEITGIDQTKLALIIKAQALGEAISGNSIEGQPCIRIGRSDDNDPVLEVILDTTDQAQANHYIKKWLQNSAQVSFELENRESDSKVPANASSGGRAGYKPSEAP